MEGQIDKTSPEYYVHKLQSDADLRNMDSKILVALYVSLKSQLLPYVVVAQELFHCMWFVRGSLDVDWPLDGGH